MTNTEWALATEIASNELRYFWSEAKLASMGDRNGILSWCEGFTFQDCNTVLCQSGLISIIGKMLDYGFVFTDIIKIIARAAWIKRQELLDAQKEDEA